MRNSNRKKSVLLNATRFFVLALCFTMVFAFALTSGNIGGVASAADQVKQDQDGAQEFGGNGLIKSDVGDMTGVHFGYPGNSANTTSWSYTAYYKTTVPTTANMQVYKETGNTDLYLMVNEANYWSGGIANAAASAQVHVTLNFDLSGFIAQMIQNDNVSVTATIQGDFEKGSNTNKMFLSAVAANTSLTASKSYELRKNGGNTDAYTYSYADKNDSGNYSSTVALTKDKPNLALAMGGGFRSTLDGVQRKYNGRRKSQTS